MKRSRKASPAPAPERSRARELAGAADRPGGTRIGAFFDLDKTIIATSSAFAFGREFMHSGLISPAEALQMSMSKAGFMIAGQSSEKMDSTRDQLAGMVTGWSVETVREIANTTMHDVVTPAIYAEARELIDSHKAAGHEVVIVSASAAVLVELIAKELGVSRVAATELEEKDGRFTGRVLSYCKGPAKAAALARIAWEEGIDLAASFAYSDSATDIPMLEQVGHPVAVNPDRHLKKYALRQGWPMRTFKHPVPLFGAAGAKEVGIGASVVAGVAAVLAAGIWIAQHPSAFRSPRHSA